MLCMNASAGMTRAIASSLRVFRQESRSMNSDLARFAAAGLIYLVIVHKRTSVVFTRVAPEASPRTSGKTGAAALVSRLFASFEHHQTTAVNYHPSLRKHSFVKPYCPSPQVVISNYICVIY